MKMKYITAALLFWLFSNQAVAAELAISAITTSRSDPHAQSHGVVKNSEYRRDQIVKKINLYPLINFIFIR